METEPIGGENVRETDLDRLERLEAAATPGPWTNAARDECGEAPGTRERYWEMYGPGPQDAVLPRMLVQPIPEDRCSSEALAADMEFIAAARNAMPRLLAEIRRLRSEMKP